ncbi:VanZ family protein [Arthrobacter sp. A2-55]|uniref:VanZ family protein n=1 Tax=Arthrobacter sp. A2-55 TaxID=2897337 RepID=UPI0021CD87EC|nr:VanZ family protein [Arthrobacter sp. A2-55]MCU6479919.1 VanZ family protein [Arthrobacter sp. A2-55]
MIKPLHHVALTAAAVYLVGVALVVFWPTPVDRPASGDLHLVINWMHAHGLPMFIGYNQVEFTANIAMFVPMGLIASTWFKNGWVSLAISSLASCFIEFSQYLFLPHRFASGMDVLANTTGAAIGAAVYFVDHRRLGSLKPSVERVEDPLVEPAETVG